MRVSIVGTGYVGLVTGACLAEKGHDVTCVDIDPGRVAALNRAEAPIFEDGLKELLQKNVGTRLRATIDLAEAVMSSDLTLIAVGTPYNGKAIELSAVLQAASQVGTVLKHKPTYHVIVIKSTVVPGTTELRVSPALESASGRKAGSDFGVGMNPEFLSEGEAVKDFMFPDRIVLGGIDSRTIDRLEALYEPFPDAPRIRTNPRTAELIKYASNALLANLISFSNEIANIGSALGGIDTVDVMRGVHLSQYFRSRNEEGLPTITSFLKPGCGFGGSCLPKDVKALIAHAKSLNEATPMLETIIAINDKRSEKIVGILEKHWPRLAGINVTLLGLSFKPGTSDVRESPAFPIMTELLRRGAVLTAYDPVATDEARRIFAERRVNYCDSLPSALTNADAVVVVTPWKEFSEVPALLRNREPPPVFVDCRRAFHKAQIRRYEGIGL
jgi:UDPglucose 6-dehydrogenase